MSFPPKSLFGRNLLLMTALILLAELAIAILFRQWIHQPRMAAMQRFCLQQALASHALLTRLDAPERQHWPANFGQPSMASVTRPGSPWVRQFMQELTPVLQQQLGNDVRLLWQEAPRPALWLGLQIDQRWYWQELDHSGLPQNIPPFMLAVTLAAGALALLAAALIQRRINQPLQELAAAAVAVGHGEGLPANLPQAPTEIAQLARSMQQMARDLDSAERERALMLAGVSHDLRTPLTKLRLAVEILASGNLPEGDAALLQGMVGHIGAANSVIEQFVAFARCANDEAEQDIDLAELLQQAQAQLTAEQARAVTLRLPDAPMQVRARPIALLRAVANLLENALRYADNGQIGNIELAAHPDTDDPTCCRICVADQGPGILDADLERIKQPFVRLDQHSTQPGSGLGLAIVERIARLNHGHLHLSPRAGGGLVACLVLPRAGVDFENAP